MLKFIGKAAVAKEENFSGATPSLEAELRLAASDENDGQAADGNCCDGGTCCGLAFDGNESAAEDAGKTYDQTADLADELLGKNEAVDPLLLSTAVLGLSDGISQHLFSHVRPADRTVWQ